MRDRKTDKKETPHKRVRHKDGARDKPGAKKHPQRDKMRKRAIKTEIK